MNKHIVKHIVGWLVGWLGNLSWFGGLFVLVWFGLVGFSFNASLEPQPRAVKRESRAPTKGSKEGPPCGRRSCSPRVLDWARQAQPRDRMCGLTQADH